MLRIECVELPIALSTGTKDSFSEGQVASNISIENTYQGLDHEQTYSFFVEASGWTGCIAEFRDPCTWPVRFGFRDIQNLSKLRGTYYPSYCIS